MNARRVVVLLLLISSYAFTQVQGDNSQRYRVLAASKVKALQRELDEAAAAGYRVTYGDMANNILILERTPDKYQYRLIQNESMDAAVMEGFSIVATTFSADRYKAGMVMEKRANAGSLQAHDYRVLGTARTKTLQKELNEVAAKGYELTAMSTYGANAALLEKRSPTAPAAPDRYLLLATTRTSTMQNDELMVIMEKAAQAPEYLLLTTARIETLDKEINDAAARGFRPLPGTLAAIARKKGMYTVYPNETSIVMEKVANPERFTYKFIATTRVGTFGKELTQAAGEGFELIGFTLTFDEQVGLLRRTTAALSGPQNTPQN